MPFLPMFILLAPFQWQHWISRRKTPAFNLGAAINMVLHCPRKFLFRTDFPNLASTVFLFKTSVRARWKRAYLTLTSLTRWLPFCWLSRHENSVAGGWRGIA